MAPDMVKRSHNQIWIYHNGMKVYGVPYRISDFVG